MNIKKKKSNTILSEIIDLKYILILYMINKFSSFNSLMEL